MMHMQELNAVQGAVVQPGDVDVPMATVVVNGIPIGMPQLGIDAMPLVDAQTAGVLGAVNNFTIKQRVRWAEAITQGCIEQANVYDVFDSANGNHLFVAMEKSEDCARCCCAPHHSLFVEFKNVANMNNQMLRAERGDLWAVPTAMTMEREGCFSKCGIGCCICSPMCADGMFLHAGGVEGGEAGQIKTSNDKCMGYAEVPSPFGGGLTPTLNIMDRGMKGEYRPIAKVEGPMCFGGLSELCCQSSFPISTMQPNELKTTLKKGDLAEIVKKVPAGLAAAAREAFTDSDTYTMSFQPEANLAPQQKAMMIASLVLVDYMFFEQDNGMCTYENGALKFTLFESYCCGCLLPCTVKLENRG